ncbi:pali-domain-containing protein [Neurospora tetrasperma FGSC 2509]|nr:pali-domain-containing protein [Neurospora tetrasperma FGSC 2509]
MLRPATPLAVLLFAAFGLLTLATISTPIIKQIPLSSFEIKDVGDLSFGVFGYCTSSGCSPIEIGYDTSAFSDKINSDFDIPRATRSTLSSILIVHPVAALITLINFVLAIVAHFHSPSHSARYLLVLFIVSFVDFIVCLLCFLVDVLLFIPHLSWGSYIVVAATILVAFCGLVTCAMRRTLVNRKANRKRIAENAEMSGENYYNRQAQTAPATQVTGPQPTVPMISGANGEGDKLPEFTTFEKKDDRSEERIPLTSVSPIDRSPATLVNDSTPPNFMDGAPSRSPSTTPVGRDQYGNPLPPQDGYAMRGGPPNERLNSRGRGGMPPGGYRGRSGFPGPGRGGGPPQNGRGGYGPPGRGRGGYGPPPRGYGGPGPRGGRGPPPQGYQGGPDRRPSPGAPYGPGPGVGTYGPSQPSPYANRQQSPGPQFAAPGYGNPEQPGPQYSAYNPRRVSLPRAESPPPLPGIDDGMPGPAVELDASPANPGVGQYGIRDSDSDVAGMLAMQQARVPDPDRGNDANGHSQEGPNDVYVPPRQAWNQGLGGSAQGLAPPAARGPTRPISEAVTASVASDYYEDVDPRFAEPSAAADKRPPPISMQPPPASNSYDDIPNRARSPAESENSNFTSISQRGINPRWNSANAPMPPPVAGVYAGGGGGGNVVPRRPVNRSGAGPADGSDLFLNSNPDFQLPGRGGNIPRAAGPR